MKRTIACLVAAATSVAIAQTPPPAKTQAPAAKAPAAAAKPAAPTAPKQAACAECGVVASVREMSKESKANANDSSKPSGFVVSVPLGAGGGSASAGSSSRIGKDAVQSTSTWEVIVRLDDGRVRIFKLEDPPEVRKDDKVRIENGQPVLRTD